MLKFKYYLPVYIIFAVNACLYIKINEYNLLKELLVINLKNSNEKILFYPFRGCGFANKIPTLTSSFLLSILSFRSIFIIKWNELLNYFHLPKLLFKSHLFINRTKIFDRKNYSILEDLKQGYSIRIYTYHSFTSSIMRFYNMSHKLKLFISKKRYRNIESFLQNEFLKPKYIIMKYITKFRSLSKKWDIIGIHIRTGYLSDFKERDSRFFNNNTINLYCNRIHNAMNKYNNLKLYIISDSSTVINNLTKVYKKYVLNFSIPGRICHARYSMHNSIKINKCVVKLIAENYILSECKLVIGSSRSTYFNMGCNRKRISCIFI